MAGSCNNNAEEACPARNQAEQRRWKLLFDPEADKSQKQTYILSDDDLRGGRMAELVDPTEEIIEVSTYKIPLSEQQWTNFMFNYQFVVFKTPRYWWSIENNVDGVTLQRSMEEDAVTLCFCQNPRIKGNYWKVKLMQNAPGYKTMADLILWLWKEDYLNIAYGPVSNNSKSFAKRAYKEISSSSARG